MIAYLWVALGSALGGVGRYGLGLVASRLWGEAFPWGTIAINILGSFVISFFGMLTLPQGVLPASPNLRTFVMVGICGGFTTFSSFSLQTVELARDGNWFGAMSNAALSVILCLMATTLGYVSADRVGLLRTEASTMSQTILAILDRPETAHPVLAAAKLAANRFGEARIEALHLRHHALEGFMPTEEVMTERREQEIEAAAAKKSAEIQEIFNHWRQDSGIGTWREVIGETATVVTSESANADLLVIGHSGGAPRGDAREAVRVALFDARAPILLIPDTVPTVLGRNAAVAWKPSEAAERAIDAAMPLLLRAERIAVLVQTEVGDPQAAPATQLRKLEQAGVSVTIHRFQLNGRKIGDALIGEAHGAGADLLVMGAYTHTRLGEFVFGGASREVLAAADLPVLMHH